MGLILNVAGCSAMMVLGRVSAHWWVGPEPHAPEAGAHQAGAHLTQWARLGPEVSACLLMGGVGSWGLWLLGGGPGAGVHPLGPRGTQG